MQTGLQWGDDWFCVKTQTLLEEREGENSLFPLYVLWGSLTIRVTPNHVCTKSKWHQRKESRRLARCPNAKQGPNISEFGVKFGSTLRLSHPGRWFGDDGYKFLCELPELQSWHSRVRHRGTQVPTEWQEKWLITFKENQDGRPAWVSAVTSRTDKKYSSSHHPGLPHLSLAHPYIAFKTRLKSILTIEACPSSLLGHQILRSLGSTNRL